ncbi:MAG: RES family NAD+ phosphorylase [Pseudomonadota bacterium]|nr:RES family NAD+ phosphorylase [Pseudomonadota bacterium]
MLEDILEVTKPRYPAGTQALHYLLKTPFRYDAPYPKGSRFRRAGKSEGVFYGSEHLPTALAETSYYRIRFHQASPDARLPRRPVLHTAFCVAFGECAGLDLTHPPLVRDHALWSDPSDYVATQTLAERARKADACAIRYESVRDSAARANVALLVPEAFSERAPHRRQTWSSFIRPDEVVFWRTSGDERWVFRVGDLHGR